MATEDDFFFVIRPDPPVTALAPHWRMPTLRVMKSEAKARSPRLAPGITWQGRELELETSIERMVAARWNMAERGEFYTIPPAGYELDERGQWVMNSNAAVVHALHTVFEQFDALGSARRVFYWWKDQD